MSLAWDGDHDPDFPPLTRAEWFRIARRGVPIFCVLTTGLALKLVCRLIEAPVFGMRRPATPWITVGVCRLTLALIGLRVSVSGPKLVGRGAYVSNHSSWLDIFVLNSLGCLYFVAKREVAGWVGIGWLARATGTLFIERDKKAARAQQEAFENRLALSHRLMFFPEGTTSDGLRVLQFKSTLFAAFFAQSLSSGLSIQALSLRYHAPKGAPEHVYGWWGKMAFAPHMLRILALPRQGHVTILRHPPQVVADFANRKSLATHLEEQTRAGHRVS